VVPRTEGLRTTALAVVSTKYPFRAPERHVLLRGYLGGARDEEVMKLSDEEMADTVKREMGDVLGLRGRPVVSRVFRWPGGTPQLEVGHLERMEAVRAEVASVPGLHLTGPGIRATGIPDSVADGTRAGEAAAEGVR
jgi:oxygen-dependent protoporphyrinogen oxidase